MAGHSHYKNMAHHKGIMDAKRGRLWSKLSRAIMVAAKMGGSDPVTNAKLRVAVEDARSVSMPKDNIERAIKKGAGELEGANYDEITYEGYGPGGVAVLCDILTDNRNRSNGEVRKIFEKGGGNMGTAGCVGNFNINAAAPSFQHAVAQAGGTSGIVIDNSGGSGGSNVYFSTLSAGPCTVGTAAGGCAIQATQSTLSQ